MDKFKIFLAVLKKHQFWALCGVMLCIALGCWFWAIGDLEALYQKQLRSINSDFSSVQQIRMGHPNQSVIDYVRDQTKSLKQNVFLAWETLYKIQKQKNLFPVKELDIADFETRFERLKVHPKEELPIHYREAYQTFIKNYLPKLKQQVDARRPASPASAGGKASAASPAGGRPAPIPGGPGVPGHDVAPANVDYIGTVDWNPGDYQRLESRFEWPGSIPPSTLAVALAQEDLWVYEALLRVISGTNQDAGVAKNSGPAVKRIEAIDIGKDAATSWRATAETVVRGASSGSPPPGGQTPGGHIPGGAMEMGMPPGGATPGASGGTDSAQTLIEHRYIDDKGQPVPYMPEYPYAKHPYAEFKMMPVRLSVMMNQRHLPELLARCANSSMPIEVRRVRLCKTQSTPLDLAAGVGPGGAGAGTPPMPGAGSPPSESAVLQDLGPEDVPIEIYGVIYIFNPPDREKLGVGPASAPVVTPPAGAAPPVVAPPAAAPPAGLPPEAPPLVPKK